MKKSVNIVERFFRGLAFQSFAPVSAKAPLVERITKKNQFVKTMEKNTRKMNI